MRGKFYAVALVAAFSIAAAWAPEAGAQYYYRPACTSSYYVAPAYYAAPVYYAPGYGYSGYGYSGYSRPTYSYSGYGATYGYGSTSGYAPVFGGFRGYGY